MQLLLGRITGKVVSTAKHAAYAGRKLMVVQVTTAAGELTDRTVIAVDAVGSGPGDWVLVSSDGRGVADLAGSRNMLPIREVIVGIVDRVDL